MDIFILAALIGPILSTAFLVLFFGGGAVFGWFTLEGWLKDNYRRIKNKEEKEAGDEEKAKQLKDLWIRALNRRNLVIGIIVVLSFLGGALDIIHALPKALIEANKNRIVYHYTSEKTLEEDIEPLVEKFVEAIGRKIGE